MLELLMFKRNKDQQSLTQSNGGMSQALQFPFIKLLRKQVKAWKQMHCDRK